MICGGGLQRRDVVDRKKGIVGLAEADLPALQFLLDETVTIEVIAGLEREEGGYPHHDWTEDLIADVEVVMREAAALVRQDPVIWIFGRVFRHGDAKGRALLHALEDEIDAVGAPASPCGVARAGHDLPCAFPFRPTRSGADDCGRRLPPRPDSRRCVG